MEACILDDVAKYEDNHFWMSSRRYFLRKIFETYSNYDDFILEIGPGTGYIAKYLIDCGYRNYSIGDINRRSLDLSNKHNYTHKYQFNLSKSVFIDHFNVVCLFDVLEHIDDNNLVVENIFKMLKNRGRAIITVPAHQWLWSKQDHIAYHRKRYEVKELKELLINNGFDILKANGFFFSLIPFMYLRKIFNRDNRIINENDFKERFKTNPLLNIFFKILLSLEISLFNNYSSKYGGSIILVAEKQNS